MLILEKTVVYVECFPSRPYKNLSFFHPNWLQLVFVDTAQTDAIVILHFILYWEAL